VEIAERAVQPGGDFGGIHLFTTGTVSSPIAVPLSEIDISLGISALLQIVAITLLLAFAASAIGLANIMIPPTIQRNCALYA
jgi:hypothetical protein